MRTLLWAHGIGFVVLVPWVWRSADSPEFVDLAAGAGAGLFGLAGLIFLYTGLARGRAAVVAPAAAVVGAVVPVGVGLIAGSELGWLGWLGVLVALPAIYLVSKADGLSRRGGGLGFGLGAGTFFGGYFVVLSLPGESSGLWPLVASRGVTVVVLIAVAAVLAREWLQAPMGPAGLAVVGVGVFDLIGNVGYLLATQVGSLVVVAVVASLYPAVTVLMSRVRYDERLSGGQVLGLCLGVSAVALLSLP